MSYILVLIFSVLPHRVGENSVVKVATSPTLWVAVLAASFVLYNMRLFSRQRRFFGYDRKREILATLPTFNYRGEYLSNLKYPPEIYKLTRLPPASDIPRQGPRLCGFADAALSTKMIASVSKSSGLHLMFVDDQQIVKLDALSHAVMETGSCLLAYGSDQYNDLSKFILKHIRVASGEQAFQFVGNHDLHVNAQLGFRIDPVLRTRTPDKTPLPLDYGVLAKLRLDLDNGRTITAILCAGIDEFASHILFECLFLFWKKLSKQTRNREFVGVFRFNTGEIDGYRELKSLPAPLGGVFAFRDHNGGYFHVNEGRFRFLT